MPFMKHYLNRQLFLEFAPSIIFFIVNFGWGIMWATAGVILAAIVCTVLGVFLEKRVPVFPAVSVILVLLLGGATLIFQDETFIKIKSTISILLFASALAFGLLLRPTLLARALEGQVYLSDLGWKVLTFRWTTFAIMLAALNEIIWRTQSTDMWVTFNTVLTPISIVGYIAITRFTAPAYWLEEYDHDG